VLRPGEYRFRIEKTGYQPKDMQMTVAPGLSTKVTFHLTRIAALVTFESEPSGARVFLNGELLGLTPVQKEGVEAGSHQVKFQLEDHREQIQELKVEGTAPVVLRSRLTPKAASTVLIKSPLAGGNVYLGHRWLGQTSAGESRVSVPPGDHRLVVFGHPFPVSVPAEGEAVLVLSEEELGLARVPEGPFWFGSGDKMPPANCYRAEKKSCKEFWIDRREVTVEQYLAFVEYVRATQDHSRCHKGEPPNKDHSPDVRYLNDPRFHQPRLPVVGIDFFDAYAYASWAGKWLPTEIEWEKAARGAERIEFPWGNAWNPRALNYHDLGTSVPADEKDSFDGLAPVGSFEAGRSPYGCYDMAGNAAEWCADTWDAQGQMRVTRGGDWVFGERDNYRVWWRESQRASYRGQRVGFRCAVRP
jgi:formylglycine-generating enzyme required for sulfatase activity